MKHTFDVTLSVAVFDGQQLLDAALAHPDAAGMTRADFTEPDGSIKLGDCLGMLLDPGSLPGCTIHGHESELVDTEADEYCDDCGEPLEAGQIGTCDNCQETEEATR